MVLENHDFVMVPEEYQTGDKPDWSALLYYAEATNSLVHSFVKEDPITARMLRRTVHAPDEIGMPIDSPEMAIAEQRMISYSMLKRFQIKSMYADALRRLYPDAPDHEINYYMASVMASRLLTATPYIWSVPTVEAAKKLEIPDCEIGLDTFRDTTMWWTFQNSYDHIDGDYIVSIDGILIDIAPPHTIISVLGAKYPNGMKIGEAWGNGSAITVCDSFSVEHGSKFSGDMAIGSTIQDTLKMVLAMETFLESPFIPKEDRKLPRSTRRECDRVQKKTGVNYNVKTPITTIDLRAVAKNEDGSSPKHDSPKARVDWECRWLVRGHLRNQYYPSTDTHRLKYIHPYMKGPEDKPIKERVYYVRR